MAKNKNSQLFSCGHCHRYFKAEDSKFKETKILSRTLTERCCPYCLSIGITRADHEFYLNKISYYDMNGGK